MCIVALALFEYAILLSIRYGKQDKIDVADSNDVTMARQQKCKKIDKYAMRFLLAANIGTIGTYFYVYY